MLQCVFFLCAIKTRQDKTRQDKTLNSIDEKSKAARVDEKDNDDRTPLHCAV